MVTVVEWVADSDIETDADDIGWMGGWFGWKRTGARWEDYLDAFGDSVRPYLEAVRASVLEHNLRLTGEQHQHGGSGVPVFSDGKMLRLSYRAWGDLMAAIWSEEEDKDYNYMDFYI